MDEYEFDMSIGADRELSDVPKAPVIMSSEMSAGPE